MELDKDINEIKYYSPDLNEFRIGFEYEIINQTSKKHLKEVFNPWRLDYNYFIEWETFKESLNEDQIRVRYLDVTDLNFLGFNFEYKNVFRKDKYFMYIEDFVLGAGYRIKIYYAKVKDPLFVGYIKNISELKNQLALNKIESEIYVNFKCKEHVEAFNDIVTCGDAQKTYIDKGITSIVFDINYGNILAQERIENADEPVIFETLDEAKYTQNNIHQFIHITNEH